MKLIITTLLIVFTSTFNTSNPPTQGDPEQIKLSTLFADLNAYNGQTIRVSGKCVKVNNAIMGKNWVHIQDGSGDGLDLTITTQESVSVDDEVTFEGIIKTNVDVGAGYYYKVIMEEAKLIKSD